MARIVYIIALFASMSAAVSIPKTDDLARRSIITTNSCGVAIGATCSSTVTTETCQLCYTDYINAYVTQEVYCCKP
ncbi:hypothetical protein TWF694_003004 [Orbilia ellipsospora]|uniref:Uncharacterized protein n=1 Tax=Orbilia ellipsospora TaxID=2528407 RepID=A0AAV9X0C4_9PEZI